MKHARCEKPARARSCPGERPRRIDIPMVYRKTTGERDGEKDTALGKRCKKKRCASVTTRRCAGGNRLVDGLAGKRDAGAEGEMRLPGCRRCERVDSGVHPTGMTGHAAPAGATPNRFSAWDKWLVMPVWWRTGRPDPGHGPVFPLKRGFCCLSCGQATAYPQDRMCRTTFTEDNSVFLQHPCKLDTILVQRVCDAVNR
jgi:hypothetical protein